MIEVTRARVQVRLKGCNDSFLRIGGKRGLESRSDLGRMMSVVVDDRDAVHFTHEIESSLDTAE